MTEKEIVFSIRIISNCDVAGQFEMVLSDFKLLHFSNLKTAPPSFRYQKTFKIEISGKLFQNAWFAKLSHN